jgi:hypothetical protein
MDIEGLKRRVILLLTNDLDARLAYHNLEHTLDVYDAAIRLAEMEDVNKKDLPVLQATALLHDIGMLREYIGHEEKSVEIARELLPGFKFGKKEIDKVCEMIMSTMLPQNANGNLEQIICDADLDYLGRPDFHMISLRLKYEWDILGIRPTTLHEWYRIQVDFLSNHTYFTASAKKLRQEMKEEHLRQIMDICSVKNNN